MVKVLFLTLPARQSPNSLTAVPRVSWGKCAGHEIPLRCVHRLRAPCDLLRLICANRTGHSKGCSGKNARRVVLRGDVLLPDVNGKVPVLIYRTPYGKR